MSYANFYKNIAKTPAQLTVAYGHYFYQKLAVGCTNFYKNIAVS